MISVSNLGPRPVADPALRLSAARGAVLAFVVEAGRSVTVQEVASSSGQHVNTVREHLEALVEAGLVTRQSKPPSGRGRPAIAYAAEAESSPLRGNKEYVALVDALVAHIKDTSPDVLADAEAVGRRWAADTPKGESVEEMLTRMGFDPVLESTNTLLLRTCPVLAAAKRNPDVVCAMHLGLLRTVHGEEVDLEPFVKDGCLLHLAPAKQD